MKIFITLFLSSLTILLFMFDDTMSKKQTDKAYDSIMTSFDKLKNSIEHKDNLGNLLLKNKNSEISIENDMLLDSSILLDKDLKIIGNGKTIYVDNVMIPFFLSKKTKLVLENLEIKAINTKSFIASKGYGEVELRDVTLHNIYGSTFKFYKVNTEFNNVKFLKNDTFVEQDNNFLFFSSCDKVSINNSNFYFNKSEQPPLSFEEIRNLTFKNNHVETFVTGLFGSLHFWNVESGEVSNNTIEDINDDRITVIAPNHTEDEVDDEQIKEVSSYMQGSIAFSVMVSEGLDIKSNILKTYNVIFDDSRYLSSEKIDYIKKNNIIDK